MLPGLSTALAATASPLRQEQVAHTPRKMLTDFQRGSFTIRQKAAARSTSRGSSTPVAGQRIRQHSHPPNRHTARRVGTTISATVRFFALKWSAVARKQRKAAGKQTASSRTGWSG